jgi:anti-sigma regulatory factor (Ser/Thr protein kinase)
MKEFECFLENKEESIKFSRGIIESYILSHIDDFCQEFLTETKTIVEECVSNCVLHSYASEIIMSI